MTTGIYKLNFIGTDKVYIGKGTSIESRLKRHISLLKSNTHSVKMNAAFLEFGLPSMEILAECSIDELNSFENETIEIYNAVDNGFNTLYRAEDMPDGSLCPGELNGRAKYSNIKITEVFNLLVDSPSLLYKDISSITDVSINVIEEVARGARHTWLSKEFPERYIDLMALKGTRNSNANCAKTKGITYKQVKSPTGILYTVDNIYKFAQEHGLDDGNLCRLLNGKAKSVKGWKLA